jgi:opacity protein-like surface antigen
MMKRSLIAILAVLLAAPACADEWVFVLINRTEKGITLIEVAPTGTAAWQVNQPDPDKASKPVTEPGARVTVRFDNGPGCAYDLRATFVDDSRATTRIDVCDNTYVTVSLDAAGAVTFKAN